MKPYLRAHSWVITYLIFVIVVVILILAMQQ